MPLSDDDIKDIKAMIAVAKKGPVNIGICLGKTPEGTIIKMDRKRAPGMLAKQAKAEGETPKLLAGRIEIDGKQATITCTEEPPGSMAKTLKAAFKDIVQVMLDFTFVVDASAADEAALDTPTSTEAPVQSTPTARAAPDAAPDAAIGSGATKSQWDTAWAEVEPKLTALLGKAGAEAAKLAAVRDFALGKAAAGQFDAAIKALKSLIQLMATVATMVADTKPADTNVAGAAPEVDTKALVQQLGQIKPQITALQGPVGVKLTEMFQAVVALVKSGAMVEAVTALARITAALDKIAASTAQAAARTASAAQTQTPGSAEAPQTQTGPQPDPRTEKLGAAVLELRAEVGGLAGGDARSALLAVLDKVSEALTAGEAEAALAGMKRVQDGLKLQAEVDRLSPLVAAAASQGKVADVNALTTLFNLVAETIPAANHAKAMENLAKVAAMIAEGAKQGTSAFEAEIGDDVRPFITSRLSWAKARSTLRDELGKLQKAITDTFAGIEDMQGAANDLSPLFGYIDKLDHRLEDKLDQIVNSTPGPERSILKVEARSLLDTYAVELSNPFFADVDQDNGFMSVAVASTARGAMADLSKVLAA